MYRFLLIVLICGVALSACSNSTPLVDLDAEVAQIRASDRALLDAETNRDLDAAMALFAEGAVLHPPEAPPVIGREAVRAFYADWFGIPYTGIYPDSDTVVLSSAGDLAYLIGNSHIEMDASAGGGRLDGKYVSLWRKVSGRWLCTGVSWSGNTPSG
jgi:ketosteroid isomerase-like protein